MKESVRLLKDEIGVVSAYLVGIPAEMKANKFQFTASADADQPEKNKTALKTNKLFL